MHETLIGLPKNDSFEMHYKFGLCMTGAGLWVLSREKFHKRMFLEISDKSSRTMTWSAKRSLLGRGSFLAYVTLVQVLLAGSSLQNTFYCFILLHKGGVSCFCLDRRISLPPQKQKIHPFETAWPGNISTRQCFFFFGKWSTREATPPKKNNSKVFDDTFGSCKLSL